MNRSLLVPVLFSTLALAGCPTEPAPDAGTDSGGVDTGGTMIDGGGVMSDVPVPPSDAPSGGRVCSVGEGACDVIAQGCAPDGTTAQGCYLTGDETMAMTICAMSGTLSEGTACTGLNDCAEGLACQNGTCREYCCMQDRTDCPVGYLCQPYGAPGGVGTLPIGICVPPADCTVLPNAGCDAGEACVPTMDGTLLCASAGTNPVGAECGAAGGCVPGSGCFTVAGSPSTCIEYCLLSDPVCSETGTMCRTTASVGGGYGVCVP